MRLSNIKLPYKITNKKTTFIKTGIFSAIVACWGVILIELLLLLNKNNISSIV